MGNVHDMRKTSTHRLADVLLGETLEHFVTERRHRKPQVSWRLIARELYVRTNGQVDVTDETLRNWFPDEAAVA